MGGPGSGRKKGGGKSVSKSKASSSMSISKKKIDGNYIASGTRKDGSSFNYRFKTKGEANKFAKG